MKPGTWVAIPRDGATPGNFSQYDRKEIVCPIFGYHRLDAERFLVQGTLLAECREGLDRCVARSAELSESGFFGSPEGVVVVAVVGIVVGALLTVTVYETVR